MPNPYAPPKAPREPRRSDPRAVRRRTELLPIEGRVRGIAIVIGLVGLSHLSAAAQSFPQIGAAPMRTATALLFHTLGAGLCVAAAAYLYRLRARGTTLFLSWIVIGLTLAVGLWAAFRTLPIGHALGRAAIAGGLFAYLTQFEGALVLTEEHHALIEETPEIDSPVSSTAIAVLVATAIAINFLLH